MPHDEDDGHGEGQQVRAVRPAEARVGHHHARQRRARDPADRPAQGVQRGRRRQVVVGHDPRPAASRARGAAPRPGRRTARRRRTAARRRGPAAGRSAAGPRTAGPARPRSTRSASACPTRPRAPRRTARRRGAGPAPPPRSRPPRAAEPVSSFSCTGSATKVRKLPKFEISPANHSRRKSREARQGARSGSMARRPEGGSGASSVTSGHGRAGRPVPATAFRASGYQRAGGGASAGPPAATAGPGTAAGPRGVGRLFSPAAALTRCCTVSRSSSGAVRHGQRLVGQRRAAPAPPAEGQHRRPGPPGVVHPLQQRRARPLRGHHQQRLAPPGRRQPAQARPPDAPGRRGARRAVRASAPAPACPTRRPRPPDAPPDATARTPACPPAAARRRASTTDPRSAPANRRVAAQPLGPGEHFAQQRDPYGVHGAASCRKRAARDRRFAPDSPTRAGAGRVLGRCAVTPAHLTVEATGRT